MDLIQSLIAIKDPNDDIIDQIQDAIKEIIKLHKLARNPKFTKFHNPVVKKQLPKMNQALADVYLTHIFNISFNICKNLNIDYLETYLLWKHQMEQKTKKQDEALEPPITTTYYNLLEFDIYTDYSFVITETLNNEEMDITICKYDKESKTLLLYTGKLSNSNFTNTDDNINNTYVKRIDDNIITITSFSQYGYNDYPLGVFLNSTTHKQYYISMTSKILKLSDTNETYSHKMSEEEITTLEMSKFNITEYLDYISQLCNNLYQIKIKDTPNENREEING